MIVIASVFPKLQTVKNLEHSLKTTILEKALAVNMWKRLKYLINLDDSAFIRFFHRSRGSWYGKCLP